MMINNNALTKEYIGMPGREKKLNFEKKASEDIDAGISPKGASESDDRDACVE